MPPTSHFASLRKRRCSEAVWLASWPSPPRPLQQALLRPELRWSRNLTNLFSPRALHSQHYRHLVGILGSPGSAVEDDGHARCCEQGPGQCFPLLIFSVRASWQLHGPLIHAVTPTGQADLRTQGLRETEQAGDLGPRPRKSGLRGPWVG